MTDIPPPGDGSDLPPEHWEITEADVRKGDTEWECHECGTVTTIDEERFENLLGGGNLSTKRCEGCRRIMQGATPFKERQTFEEWQEEQEEAEQMDALNW